jgi:hypothetical protein
MTQATIATDVHQPLDVHLYTLAQVALNLSLCFQDGTDPAQLVLTQVLNPSVDIYSSLFENGRCPWAANAVDVSQSDLRPFVRWKVNTSYTCHYNLSPKSPTQKRWLTTANRKSESKLSLSLLMFRIYADHPHHTLAVDDFALVAHLLY